MNTISKKLLWGLMAFLAAAIAISVVGQYLPGDPALYFEDQRAVYIANRAALMTHILGASAALLIGPFQFLPAMRRKKSLNLHRWLGRIYLLGILFGGFGGLYMARLAHGGIVAQIGFGTLAILWLTTGYLAYQRVRARDIKAHERWMKRNFALTFAAVMLRLWLLILAFGVGLEFTTAYIIVAWLCWVPNILFAEWLIRRRQNRNIDRVVSGTAAD